MNRRLITASALLACCLAGCAANKDFEKEILGHPAPEQPSDTGWTRQKATPPPPPPPPATARPTPPAPYAPAPVATPSPAPVASPPAMSRAAASMGIAPPLVEPAPAVTEPRFAPKPFKPEAAEGQNRPPAQGVLTSPPAPQAGPGTVAEPAPTAPASAASDATAGAPSDRAVFTFMVGSFAHNEKAGELMASLESRGFSTRMDQGKLNNKTFYKVFAVKEGNRAELEGELFAAGVTEPRLVAERPVDKAAPQKSANKAGAKVAPAAAPKTSSPRPSGNIPPPIVEPAPPLPDGYVPPPPKSAGS
ncbi:MAG: SPOR domain-containing protein [Acidobacteriota bacterium]